MDYAETTARLAAISQAGHDSEIEQLEAAVEQADAHVILGEKTHRAALASVETAGARSSAAAAATAIIEGAPLTAITTDRTVAERNAQAAFDGLQELRRRAATARNRLANARSRPRKAAGEAIDDLADQLEAEIDEAVQTLASRFAIALALSGATSASENTGAHRLTALARRMREPLAHLVEGRFLARSPVAVPDDAIELLEVARNAIEAGGGRIIREVQMPRPHY